MPTLQLLNHDREVEGIVIVLTIHSLDRTHRVLCLTTMASYENMAMS